MKVLLLGSYPLGDIYGGVPVYTHKFAYYLSEMGNIDTHVMTFGSENKEFKQGNLTVYVINKRLFPLSAPTGLRRLLKITRRIDPDIIDIQGTHFPLPLIAMLLRKKNLLVLSVLATISRERKYYEIGFKYYGTSIFQLLNIGLLERYAISKTPYIVVETRSVKDMISKWTKSKIYVIPDGVEYGKIQDIEAGSDRKPDILFVGRLVKVKGIDILIRAIPIVKRAIPNITVYIAGYGPRENELRDLVKKLDLNKHVKFLGFVPENDKFKYYKASKIVAIPSRWENSPITLYEAMASGKAVVASNVSGIPDVLEDGKTGFLFECEDVEELANKIIILLTDEALRNAMGTAARDKAKEYDWRNVVKKRAEIYEAIISETKFERGFKNIVGL